jgi:hypothetical protein
MESLFQFNVPLAQQAHVHASVRQLTDESQIIDVYFTNQRGVSVLLGQKKYKTNLCSEELAARAILDICYDVQAQITALAILQQKVTYVKI